MSKPNSTSATPTHSPQYSMEFPEGADHKDHSGKLPHIAPSVSATAKKFIDEASQSPQKPAKKPGR